MADVLAVAEVKGGAVQAVSFEVVAVARRIADALGGAVEVAVAAGGQGGGGDAGAGPGGAGIADALGARGADRVLEVAGAESVDALAEVAAGRVRGGGHGAVVFAATGPGRDLAPRVAARLAAPLLTDVTEVEVEGGSVVATRPVYAGKALARVRVDAAPALLSLRPNVFAAGEPDPQRRPSSVERVEAAPSAAPRYRVRGFELSTGASLDVSEAAVVVSGGRGMKGPENWGVLEDLRDALGETAALGASRAVVDAGWRPHAEQVGQTGKTVTPKLYFAMAISGAVQHLAGMRTAGVIVAVNRDRDAPIFGVADYGIVGDVFEVAPALAAAVRKLRGE